MPGETALLLAALFALAAAAGWYGARIFRPSNDTVSRSAVNPDYVRGLQYLLDEQPDKALEMFLKMVDVDSDTLETHFALGSLFRRRGEVDRAIRIHQNLIARPNLSRVQRDEALFALAEDYLKAGLLDRAEKLFVQLVTVPAHSLAALSKLVSIYELQKDWQQAVRDDLYRLELANGGIVSIPAAAVRRVSRDAGDEPDRSEAPMVAAGSGATAAAVHPRAVDSSAVRSDRLRPVAATALETPAGKEGAPDQRYVRQRMSADERLRALRRARETDFTPGRGRLGDVLKRSGGPAPRRAKPAKR